MLSRMDLQGIGPSAICQQEKDEWFPLHVEFQQQNKWAKKREINSNIQRINWWLPEERRGGWVKEVEGIERCQLSVIKGISHRERKYSIGDTVNNIIITVYGDRWQDDLPWWSFHNVDRCQITLLYTWNEYCLSTMIQKAKIRFQMWFLSLLLISCSLFGPDL